MRAHLLRSEIVQLPTLALVDGLANLRTARAERTAHIQSRNRVVATLFVAAERILKAGLVDRRRVDYRGFRQLHVLVCRKRVEAALGQRETADALILDAKAIVVVTKDERVSLVDCVIEARTKKQIAPRHDERLAKIDWIKIVVKHGCAHEFVVVSFNASEVEKERCFPLYDWTIQVHLVLSNLKGRALARRDSKWIARVEALVVEIERCAAAEFVGAGTRQNIDARRGLIVLCREGI